MKHILAILSILVLIAGCSTSDEVTGSAITDIEEPTEEVPEVPEETITEETEELETVEEVSEYSISIVDRKFQPKFLTVPIGSTVIWTHNDELATKHIVLVKGEEKSSYLFKGDTYEFTFTEAGKYLIQDPIYLETAVGQIIVE